MKADSSKGRGAAVSPRPRGRTLPWYELMPALEKAGPRGVYAFCGPEAFLRREALAAMKRSLRGSAGPAEGRYAVESFGIGEHETSQILSAASQAGLFGGDRLVLVEGLERYARLGPAEKEAWFALIAAQPVNPVVLVSEQTSRELIRRAKALAELLAAVTVVDFWHLSPERALAWVRKHGASAGLQISAPAAAQMVRHLGSDLMTLAAEIEKIALARGPGTLEVEELRELARRGIVSSSWEAVECILNGELRPALESIQAVRREESAFGFAWKLKEAVARSLVEGRGTADGPPGAGAAGAPWERRAARPPAGAERKDASCRRKKSLGRLLWGCYEWERGMKTGRWAGTHDYAALEGVVIAHVNRCGKTGGQR
jgi:DNA polymerase III delta subunit